MCSALRPWRPTLVAMMQAVRVCRSVRAPAFCAIALCAMLACTACAAPAGGAAPGDGARVPPMSTPYPPKRVASPPALVTACRADADCAVKDVGSCCGAMPACVNRDSAVDPAAVRAQCAQDGRVGVCGFREIQGCRCDAGQCRAADAPRLTPPDEARRR